MTRIHLSFNDLEEIVRRVLPATADDGLDAFGHVRAEARGDSIRWVATDRYRMVTLERGTHDGLAKPVLVPASLLDFASRAAPSLGNEQVEIRISDHEVVVAVGGLTVPRPLIDGDFPDTDQLLDAVPDSCPVSVRVRAPELVAAIHANSTFAGPEGWDSPIGLTRRADGPLTVTARWEDRPDTSAFVSCVADGDVTTLVNPRFLLELLNAVGPCDTTLLMGGPSEPLRLRTDDGLHALLMPFDSELTRLCGLVADAIGRDPDELSTDNGRVEFDFDGVTVQAEPIPGPDPFGRHATVVFTALLAEDLCAGPDLLAELNQLNQGIPLCFLVLCDSAVEARSQQLLPALDAAVIRSVCREMSQQVQKVGPLIEAVHR